MGVIDSELAGFGSGDDAHAVERYRYVLHTAPPDDLERTHTAAFEGMSFERRRAVRLALGDESTEAPASLARLATRLELHKSGELERLLGDDLFRELAVEFVSTVLADTLFSGLAYEPSLERVTHDDDDFGDAWDEELDGSEFATRH